MGTSGGKPVARTRYIYSVRTMQIPGLKERLKILSAREQRNMRMEELGPRFEIYTVSTPRRTERLVSLQLNQLFGGYNRMKDVALAIDIRDFMEIDSLFRALQWS